LEGNCPNKGNGFTEILSNKLPQAQAVYSKNEMRKTTLLFFMVSNQSVFSHAKIIKYSYMLSFTVLFSPFIFCAKRFFVLSQTIFQSAATDFRL
jgi:hypothetical protein